MSNILYQLYRLKKIMLPKLNLRQYGVVQRFRSKLVKSLQTTPVEVLGQQMWLDPTDALQLALNRIYEPVETELLKSLIKPGMTIVDVGANIGYYSLIFAKDTGPQGKVYSFEPSPGNFELLTKNLKLNGHTNVVAENVAVMASSGTLDLYMSEASHADHQVYDSGEGRRKVSIPGVALDEYFAGKGVKVDLIKMDIQGAELFALQGMRGLLTSNPGIKLLTEFWPYGLKRSGTAPGDYFDALVATGMKISHVEEKDGTMTPAVKEAILSRYPDDTDCYCNLLCEAA